MLAPTHELIQRTAIYDDRTELADALRELAKDDVMDSPSVYCLKECAEHIEGLYEHAQELTRALRGASRELQTLVDAADKCMTQVGAEGQIDSRHEATAALMDALHEVAPR